VTPAQPLSPRQQIKSRIDEIRQKLATIRDDTPEARALVPEMEREYQEFHATPEPERESTAPDESPETHDDPAPVASAVDHAIARAEADASPRDGGWDRARGRGPRAHAQPRRRGALPGRVVRSRARGA
jgi:hypothetical protein